MLLWYYGYYCYFLYIYFFFILFNGLRVFFFRMGILIGDFRGSSGHTRGGEREIGGVRRRNRE